VAEPIAPTVENNAAARQFEIHYPDGIARLVYRYDPAGRLVLVHTEVPPALGGRGIAGLLAKTAFEFADEAHLRVIPECPFVQTYLARHPEYERLVDR
jgi:predicted GNAT family acetyltransferase